MWECFSYFNRFIFWHFTSLISLCHTFRAAYTRSCRCLECTGGSIQLASLESSVWLRFIRTGRCVHAQYGFLVTIGSKWEVRGQFSIALACWLAMSSVDCQVGQGRIPHDFLSSRTCAFAETTASALATVALSWWEASYLCWTLGCYSQVCIWYYMIM